MSKITLQPDHDCSRPYRILLFCRSSDGTDENGRPVEEKRLDEQEARLRDWVRNNIEGTVEVGVTKLVESCSSRESVREQLAETVRSGKWNLILVAGLDRVTRVFDVHEFLKLAAAEGTRIIAIADSFDSGEPGWLFAMTFAALRNESERIDRARRIRRRRYYRLNNPEFPRKSTTGGW